MDLTSARSPGAGIRDGGPCPGRSSAATVAVVEHVIHRLAEPALPHRLGAHADILAAVDHRVGAGTPGVNTPGSPRFADDTDAHEAGSLEERVHLPHRRQRFDPRHRTCL